MVQVIIDTLQTLPAFVYLIPVIMLFSVGEFTAMGCTPTQVLKRVQLPLASPDIMLGVNQTLMMGLSMLVITALVGTRDLGQETLIALSKVDPGRGVTAGICVAFIAITADRLINAWTQKRKSELGLDAASQL